MVVFISIIIPVLNEEATVLTILSHLEKNLADPENCEIIVVDGGSSDKTIPVVEEFCNSNSNLNCSVNSSSRGRAKQMHAGALRAKGEIFHFLHVDSFPPFHFDDCIREAVLKDHPAGCFRMKFETSHLWLKIIGWFTRFSWKASRGGDQSQYITAVLYHEIGGFDTTLSIYEDYDLINKLYERNQFYVIPKWLKTSDRRYKQIGVMRLQYYYLWIYFKKYRGASVEEIQSFYKHNCG